MNLKEQIDSILSIDIKPELIDGELIPSLGERGKWNNIIVPLAKNAQPTQEILEMLNACIFAFENNLLIRETLNDVIDSLNQSSELNFQ